MTRYDRFIVNDFVQDSIIPCDSASARHIDEKGHMHVSETTISKANIRPYYGRELPTVTGADLDQDRIYQVFCDPKELELAASTFNGLPLLDTHKPLDAWDHPFGLVVGAVGNDATFKYPYLMNSLTVWTSDAIEDIESGDQQELSAAYTFDPVWEPGEYQGQKYDGRMTNIKGNHVALVQKGRAGSDVVVRDSSAIKETSMAKLSKTAALVKGALLASNLKFAQDKSIDYNAILYGVTAKTMKASKPAIISAIKKVAQDADAEGLAKLLDHLEASVKPEDDDEANPNQPKEVNDAPPSPAARPVDTDDTVLAKVRETLANLMKLLASPEATTRDEGPVGSEPPTDDPDKRRDMIDKPAMDAAIVAAVRAAESSTIRRLREISEATAHVRPWVGDLAVTCDSAESVYGEALKVIGVDLTNIPPVAYRHILIAQPKPGATAMQSSFVAMDAAEESDFSKKFPLASRFSL